MNFYLSKPFIILIAITSCISIPRETVQLSKVITNDLIILQSSHSSLMQLYFEKIKENIDSFIDDIYAPFITHYALKSELEKHQKKETQFYIYRFINLATYFPTMSNSRFTLSFTFRYLKNVFS